MQKTKSGFTIVELLIVIVVIAILAAISVVAYNGVQQRSKNTATIAAVSQTLKAIQAHVAQENSYPVTNNYACVTSTSGCVEPNGTVRAANTVFDTNIAKVALVTRSVPNTDVNGNGVTYNHSDSRLFNGEARPALLMYFLVGQSQNCGVSGVMSAWGTPGQDAVTSTTGFTGNNASANKTICFVSVPQ